MKRILIPNQGPIPKNAQTALTVAIRKARECNLNTITLITPVRNSLESEVYAEVQGSSAVKQLKKGRTVTLRNYGVRLAHETTNTLKRKHRSGIGIAFYTSMTAMLHLDQLDIECLIFVPWLTEEGVEWAQKWNADTFGATTTGSEVHLSEKVITALKSLTAYVNLSTGLGHSSDRNRAKLVFAGLKADGIKWDSAHIERWAVRNGWRVDYAQTLIMVWKNWRAE